MHIPADHMHTYRGQDGTMELRKAKRYQISAHAVFCWEGLGGALEERKGCTRDICYRGSFVSAESAPPNDARVQINLYFPPSPQSENSVALRGEGKVVRVERVNEVVKGFAAEVIFQTESPDADSGFDFGRA